MIELKLFRVHFQDDPNELHVEDDRGVWAINDKMKHTGKQPFYTILTIYSNILIKSCWNLCLVLSMHKIRTNPG